MCREAEHHLPGASPAWGAARSGLVLGIDSIVKYYWGPMYVCMYVCICVYIYIHTYIYIYIYNSIIKYYYQ